MQREPFFHVCCRDSHFHVSGARYTVTVHKKKGETVPPKVRKIERKIFNENGGPVLRAYRARARATRAFLLPRLRQAEIVPMDPPRLCICISSYGNKGILSEITTRYLVKCHRTN